MNTRLFIFFPEHWERICFFKLISNLPSLAYLLSILHQAWIKKFSFLKRMFISRQIEIEKELFYKIILSKPFIQYIVLNPVLKSNKISLKPYIIKKSNIFVYLDIPVPLHKKSLLLLLRHRTIRIN
jgi:hypothetical protein